MKALLNNLFPVIGITEPASGADTDIKEGRYAQDGVPDRNKAGEPVNGDASIAIGDKGLSLAMKKKELSSKIVDTVPTTSVREDKGPLPEIADIKPILLAIEDKRPPPKIADVKSISLVEDKRLPQIVDREPTLADVSPAWADDRLIPEIADKRPLVRASGGVPTLAKKIAYARVIFLCWHF